MNKIYQPGENPQSSVENEFVKMKNLNSMVNKSGFLSEFM